ncbi:hypothetical protein MKX03_002174 [Papaver bracteatum]|nr:hypothetical protein MKX03_002174 [Papaver bracteatum]
MTSASPNEYVWKIENFSSLSSKTHYSEIFSACGVNWVFSIEPKGIHLTCKTPKGSVVTWNGTQFVIGLSPYGTGSWYIGYSLSVINQKDKEQTTKFDYEVEVPANWKTLWGAMCLTELLDPKKGFIINDVCYSLRPKTGSVGTTTQSAANSKSASNKNLGEIQHTKTKHEKKNLSLPRWFQERKDNIGNYFNDNMDYQRLEQYD